MQKQVYQIASSNQEVIITLNRSLIAQEKLEQFLDYLAMSAIQQKSQLNEETAQALIDDIDNSVWEKCQNLFLS